MDTESFPIFGPLLLTPSRYFDSRGVFCEVYNRETFQKSIGYEVTFVQDNYSISRLSGTVRGLHYQLPPRAQQKLVRVARGSIFDVIVDIRAGSPTYGQHVSAIISADNGKQLWVPTGFAHGFCTLEPETEVTYKVSNVYSPNEERGIFWLDERLDIRWPVDSQAAVMSDKDKQWPKLGDAAFCFDEPS